uniref:Uncharacterized protein n=1 Tax=Setaria digitata TaxID=48799 RepID=A0A915PT84_9BILA
MAPSTRQRLSATHGWLFVHKIRRKALRESAQLSGCSVNPWNDRVFESVAATGEARFAVMFSGR